MIISNYIRTVKTDPQFSLQVIVPKNFLNTAKLEAGKESAMRAVMADAESFWRSEASRRLNSSRDQYLAGIETQLTSKANVVLYLRGSFALQIEDGFKGFDMKPGFLNSDKAKTGKNGKYFIVPIEPGSSEFRTVTAAQSGKWIHPGWEGAKILPDLKKMIKEDLIPKHIGKLIKDSL